LLTTAASAPAEELHRFLRRWPRRRREFLRIIVATARRSGGCIRSLWRFRPLGTRLTGAGQPFDDSKHGFVPWLSVWARTMRANKPHRVDISQMDCDAVAPLMVGQQAGHERTRMAPRRMRFATFRAQLYRTLDDDFATSGMPVVVRRLLIA